MEDSDPNVTRADHPAAGEVTDRIGDSGTRDGDRAPTPEPGETLGRYLLLAKIGEGGMGEVHRAYDPQLRREVALKLVKTDRADPVEQARLLREAQAMAQLSHPNVAAVYDAGEIDGQVFIALEYIEGPTLDRWLREREHGYAEVLEVFTAAGRGLQAAHAAGLIHRDFKPANVLVPEDGRPRVLDFGLARLAGEGEVPDRTLDRSASGSGSGEVDALASPLTQAGMVMGTPGYMAPEQHYGTDPDVRWDVYAYCVALYEALYGRRPFHGVGIRELAKSKLRGLGEAPPSGAKVPTWIYGVLRAGLHPKADRRTPDMQTLLAQLAADPARRRRRLRRMLTTGAVGAGLAVAVGLAGRAAENPCGDGAQRVGAVWNADRAREIGEAFAATGLPYAETAWTRVQPSLEGFGAAWAEQYEDACAATHVRNEQSARMLDLRMQCLRRSERELSAMLEVLADPDETVVERAHLAVLQLPAPERCADTAMLETGVEAPNDAETADAVSGVRDELARVQAMHRAGKYDAASAVVDPALERAQTLGYAPVRVEALRAKAENLRQNGRYDEAEDAFLDAYFLAAEIRYADLTWQVALDLGGLVGVGRRRHEEGELWVRHARAGLGRGREGTVDHAKLLGTEGQLAQSSADYPRARELVERALSIYADEYGPEDPRIGGLLNNLGIIADEEGRYDDAEELYRKTIEIEEETLGPDHPSVLKSTANLATNLIDHGRVDEGAKLIEVVLERERAALGPEHPYVGDSLGNLAYARYRQKRYEEALTYYREALAIIEKGFGADSAEAGHLLNSIAGCQQQLGRKEETLATLERALRIREGALGADHFELALAHKNVAAALADLGRFEQALVHNQRAVEIAEGAVGPDHFRLATFLSSRAGGLARLDRHAEAAIDHERALRIALANDRPASEIAYHRYDLARALWDSGKDREAAREQAQMARAAWKLAGVPTKGVEAWLKEHR